MSNATEPSRQSGERRRRRSRGGRNRNNNNNRTRSSGEHTQDNDNARSGKTRSNRSGGRVRQPVKLSWWQKLLKAIGLYKAPEKPKRRQPEVREKTEQAPKSNTRVATVSEKPQTRERKNNPKGKRTRGGDASTVESARVYVGNLSYDVTEQDLQELFKGVGTVRRTEIVYNRSTHRSKGYGFVEMIHKDDAIRAVEVLHDQPFMGRNMIVSGASSRPEEQDEQEETPVTINAAEIPLAPLPEPAPAAEAEAVVAEPEAEPVAAEVAAEPEAVAAEASAEAPAEDESKPATSA